MIPPLPHPTGLPNAVLTSPEGNTPAGQLASSMSDYFKDFTDLKVTIKNVFTSPDGKKIAIEWDWAITRKRDSKRGISHDAIMVDLKDGKIASWREYYDPAHRGKPLHRPCLVWRGKEPVREVNMAAGVPGKWRTIALWGVAGCSWPYLFRSRDQQTIWNRAHRRILCGDRVGTVVPLPDRRYRYRGSNSALCAEMDLLWSNHARVLCGIGNPDFPHCAAR